MRTPAPWYREPWPWLLIAPPAASIVLGLVMWTLAARTDDGLVVDDYYKQGLAINQILDRDARAAALGVRGVVAFDPGHTRVRLQLAVGGEPPSRVTLRLVHPTRAGEDQTVLLAASQHGVLEGTLRPPAPGRWRVVIENSSAGWRVSGEWHTRELTAPVEAVRRALTDG
jgi:hypothetical protein